MPTDGDVLIETPTTGTAPSLNEIASLTRNHIEIRNRY